jgi:hypothetical protein
VEMVEATDSKAGKLRAGRVLAAAVGAAIPIIGVVWWKWPLPVVLFYFWLELALVSLDTMIFAVRDRAAGDPIEFVLIGMFVFAPVVVIAWFATVHLSWPGKIDYALGMVQTPGMRLAIALQLVVVVTVAIARDLRRLKSNPLLMHMELVYNRVFVLVLVAAALTPILLRTGIGMPGSGNSMANIIAVSAVALVWMLSDLVPQRLDRWLVALFGPR